MSDTQGARPAPRRTARRSRRVVAAVSAVAFVGLGTTMALAGPGASSTAPHSNRAEVDPFTVPDSGNGAYGDLNDIIASANNDDGGAWSAQPPSAFAFGGKASGANTATHGS